MAKKWVALTTSSTFHGDNVPSENHHFAYSVSDPRKIKTALLQLIASGDKKEFKKELIQHFIYPNRGLVEEGRYKGNHHIRTWTSQSFLTRPVIEALFLEHTGLFHEVLLAVMNAQNKELEEIFYASLIEIKEIPASLFIALNKAQREHLREQISALNSIREIPADFIIALNDRLNKMSESTDPLLVLKEKLDLAQLVHSKDKEFIGMSNYKKICVNIVTILLSGCILNFMNLFVTGNFLFFNKNAAQTKIANIDKTLDQNQLLAPNEEKSAEAEKLQAQAGTTIKPISPAPVFFMPYDSASHQISYTSTMGMSIYR